MPDATNATTHLVLSADEYFNTIRVENFATSADSNAEFKVDSVSLITDLTLNYTLNIVAELTDSSETLGPVMIGQAQLSLLGATLYANGEPVSDVDADGYLTVALSDTVTLKTDHYLTVEEINSITSTVLGKKKGESVDKKSLDLLKNKCESYCMICEINPKDKDGKFIGYGKIKTRSSNKKNSLNKKLKENTRSKKEIQKLSLNAESASGNSF